MTNEINSIYVNFNWLIKVSGLGLSKKVITFNGLIEMLGEETGMKMLSRVDNDLNDRITCKLRRGLQFEFICR